LGPTFISFKIQIPYLGTKKESQHSLTLFHLSLGWTSYSRGPIEMEDPGIYEINSAFKILINEDQHHLAKP